MGNLSDIVYPELKTTEKLSSVGENFLIWKLKLAFVLADHQLPHLLNPKREDPTWNDQNDAAKDLILQTLDNDLLHEFYENPTPASIMEALLSRFDSSLKATKLSRVRRYKAHRMGVDAHINQHIFRMRAMAKELEYAGIKIPDETQAVVLLNSLPDDWDDDVERLLMDLDEFNDKSFSFDYVCRRLKVVYDVRLLKQLNNAKRLKNKFKGSCYNCGKQGHHKSNCPDQEAYKPYTFPDAAATRSEIIYHQFKTNIRIDYTGSRFSIWKSKLFQVLECNKVEYILKDPKPSEEDAQLYSKWQADDFTCRHLILEAMEDDVFLSFHDYPTAKALMDAVEGFFSPPSTAQKLVLLKKYMNNHMSDDTTTINHIIKMDLMAHELAVAGVNVPDKMQSVVLVDSLPESWGDTLTNLNMNMIIDTNNGLSLNDVRRRVRDAGQMKEQMAQAGDRNKKKRRFHRGK